MRCPLCQRPAGPGQQRFPERKTGAGDDRGNRFACTSGKVGTHGAIFWCPECRVGYSPAPDPAELLETYEAVEDPGYLDEEEHRLSNSDRVLQVIERWRRPGSLLEVGAGVGLLLHAAAMRGWSARGFEPSRWAVEVGRQRYGVDLRQGTIEAAETPVEPLDCVAMSDVLEHLVDPQAAVSKCARWLAPGGVLVLVTVNMTAPVARLMGTRWPGFMHMHLTYFSPYALDRMLHRAGLTRVVMVPAPRRLAAGYVGSRLSGAGGWSDWAARALQLPLLRRAPISLRSRDLLLVVGRRDSGP